MDAAPERHILRDDKEVAHEAAEFIVWLAEQAIRAGDILRVALSGGSTPRLLYETLSGPVFCKQVEWSSAEFYFSDERCVLPTHPDSNFRMVQEALFEPLGIPSRSSLSHAG